MDRNGGARLVEPTLPTEEVRAWARDKVLELACIFSRFSAIKRMFNKSGMRVNSRNQDQRYFQPKQLMKRQTHRVSRSRGNVAKLAALGGAGLGLVCGAKADTTITFGGFTTDNLSIGGILGYGDNVNASSLDYTVSGLGTPDITLDWVGTWDTYTSWDGRGNVGQSDFNGGPNVSILFTPSAAFAVRLGSFHLDEWAGGGDASVTWSITGLNSGSLASGVWTMSNAGGRTLITPGISGQLGEGLILNLQLNSGSPSYLALDNLTFAQVPEPSTLALGALGAATALGAAAMRRRRRA